MICMMLLYSIMRSEKVNVSFSLPKSLLILWNMITYVGY